MHVGFSTAVITPRRPMALYGFADRDGAGVSEGQRGDLMVRAAYFADRQERAVIVSCDLLFFSRAQADHLAGLIGRTLDLSPRQIMLCTTHTHSGPMLGSGAWQEAIYREPDWLYERQLADAIVDVVGRSRHDAAEVSFWSGEATTTLPLSRRLLDSEGRAVWAPNPQGCVYDKAPLLLARNEAGEPVLLLFAAACHPSTVGTREFSADYIGPAEAALNAHLGGNVSMFLPGTGGDAKPSVASKDGRWEGSWEDVERGGQLLASEILEAINAGLAATEPQLRSLLTEVSLSLMPSPTRGDFEGIADDPDESKLRRQWAQRFLTMTDVGLPIPDHVTLTMHGLQLGQGVRLVGLDAEVVARLGWLINQSYGSGVTFPLGYVGERSFICPPPP